MWEVRCVKIYGGGWREGPPNTDDHLALEQKVNEILASGEGWEPFAYTDHWIGMWLRRQMPEPISP